MKKSSPVTENGWRLKPLGPGRNLIQRSVGQEVVSKVDILGRMEVEEVPTGKSGFVYSEGRILLKLARSSAAGESGSVSIHRAEITALSTDYVTCNLWDETANDFDGASITVAKPYELRNNASGTEWSIAWTYAYASAQERTRAATGYAATKQRVFPDYKVGDELIVLFTDEHTGVTGATEYLDMNLNHNRRWLTETEGCDDAGDPAYAFIDRSPFTASPVGSNFA